jgi:hypothetical protein
MKTIIKAGFLALEFSHSQGPFRICVVLMPCMS